MSQFVIFCVFLRLNLAFVHYAKTGEFFLQKYFVQDDCNLNVISVSFHD